MRFILVKEEKKVDYEVTDGYGNKVLPGQSFTSAWFLECIVASETISDLSKKQDIFIKKALFTHSLK